MKANTLATGELNERRYWLWWILATAVGWLAAYWASILLNGLVLSFLQVDPATLSGSEPLPESIQLPLLFLELATLFVIGAAVGSTQWLIARQQLPQVSRWPLFTALGCMITLFAGPYWFVLAGLGMGLLQWLILRNVLNRTAWWAVINAVAWPIGYIAGSVLGTIVGQLTNSIAIAAIVVWGSSGAIVGAITGAVLLWLLRQNRTLLDGLREEAEQAK